MYFGWNSELQRGFPLAVSTARLAGTPGPGLAGSGGGQRGRSPCRGGPPAALGKQEEFVLCLL